MARRAPPFSALRTLEAASRLRSYTAAAAELQVTHSAVSQAIRRLEEELNTKLFYRRGSFMEPSPSSLILARAYQEAAQHLNRSLIDVAGQNAPDSLVVSLPPGFARLWLSPRLPNLHKAFPDLNINLRTSRDLASLDGDGVDIAIRFGVGPWAPCRSEVLFDLALFPVASPELGLSENLGALDIVGKAPLIDQADYPWEIWFDGIGSDLPALGGRSVFDDEQLALDQAAAGRGVALTYAQAAQDYLDTKKLVRLSPLSIPTGRSVSLLWREENPKIRLIRNFSWWLQEELGLSNLKVSDRAA